MMQPNGNFWTIVPVTTSLTLWSAKYNSYGVFNNDLRDKSILLPFTFKTSASTVSPTFKTSVTLVNGMCDNWLLWIKPWLCSNLTNAPKFSSTFATTPVTTLPTSNEFNSASLAAFNLWYSNSLASFNAWYNNSLLEATYWRRFSLCSTNLTSNVLPTKSSKLTSSKSTWLAGTNTSFPK